MSLTVLPTHVTELLSRPCPAVIATVGPDGRPVSVITWYLLENDGHVLLSIDADNARGDRLEHLRRDPRLSLTVMDPQNWYTALTVVGRAVQFFDDEELAAVDRMGIHYTGETYPKRAPRVAVRVAVDAWY